MSKIGLKHGRKPMTPYKGTYEESPEDFKKRVAKAEELRKKLKHKPLPKMSPGLIQRIKKEGLKFGKKK